MAKRKRIPVIDFETAVADALAEYSTSAISAVDLSIDEVAEQAEQKLKSVRRFAPDGNPSGKYSNDWETETYKTGRFSTKAVVYNVENYRLTHLLEFGHVTRNGTGRTFDPTPAYPHIAPVNDWVHDEIIKQIQRRLE